MSLEKHSFPPFRCDIFECYLRFPLQALSYCRLGPSPSTCSKKFRYLHSIYSFFVILVLLLAPFTCYAIIDWKKGLLDKGVSYFLAMALWITQGTLVGFMLIHKSRKGQLEILI